MIYGGRQQGKAYRQAAIIRSVIDARGLPYKNFVLARIEYMVAWDSITGEVKTLKYNERKAQIRFISYEESWVYKKFMEHSNVTLEKPALR